MRFDPGRKVQKGNLYMKMSGNLRRKLPWFGIGMLVMALIVSACGNQPVGTSGVPTAAATTSAGNTTATSVATGAGTTTAIGGNGGSVESSKPLTSVLMVSQSVGWAIAQKTMVLRTTDGGNHWTDVTPHYSNTPQEITPAFVDGLHASIGFVGMMDQSPITVLRTSDGGQSWQAATITASQPTGVVSMQFRGNNHQIGWVLAGIDGGPGAGHEGFGLYTTTNGGQSWSALPSIYTSDQIGGLSFLDTTTGFLAFGGPYAAPQLSVTHDGGHSWKNLSLPVVPGLPAQADEYFTTPPVFFGSSGFLPVYLSVDTSAGKRTQGFVIYTTSDSGATWVAKGYNTLLAVGEPMATSDLYIVDPTHAYVTNAKGATLLSSNGGTSWATLTGTVGTSVTSLSFTDSQHGWAAGGGLWHTADGGNSWQAVNYTILGS
jgi:photosystem II stability/assembly factor-like uncharacterized protein